MNDQILNAPEASVLADKAFFLIKARLDAKIKALLEGLLLQLEQRSLPRLSLLPPEMQAAQSRFFQGELHEGFPWRAIDHRAVYGRDALLAFRCLIRYGGPLSLHWMVSGDHFAHLAPRLATHAHILARHGFQLSLHDTPWTWAPDAAPGYLGLRGISPEAATNLFKERTWVKFSAFFPTDDLDGFPDRALAAWDDILDLLCAAQPQHSA
jgi:hypothetical protein